MKASRAYTPVQHVFGLTADLTPWPEKARIRKQHAAAASTQGMKQHPGSSLVAASQGDHFACISKQQCCQQQLHGQRGLLLTSAKGHNLLGGETVVVLV